MKALQDDDHDTAIVLIRLGADVFTKNSSNEAPIDLIFRKNLDHLKKVVEEVCPGRIFTDFQNNALKNSTVESYSVPEILVDHLCERLCLNEDGLHGVTSLWILKIPCRGCVALTIC